MAKTTAAERQDIQEALGLDTGPVEFDVQVPAPELGPSDQDIVDRATEEADVGFFDAVGASFRVDNSAYAIYENLGDPDFYYDPDFDSLAYVDSDDIRPRIDALTLADRDEVLETLGGAFNRDHADHLLERLERKQEDEITIAQAGAKGLVARLGANVVDPVDLAVSAAAAPLGVAVKGRKLGRIATIAGTAGVANAAVEGVVAQDNPFRDETDIIYAGLAGITLGGALGTLLTRAENLRLEKAANGIARDHLDSVGASRRVLSEGEGPNAPLAPRSEQKLADILGEEEAPEFASFLGLSGLFGTNLRGKLFEGTEAARSLASRMLEGGFLKDKAKARVFTAEGRADAIYRSFTARMFNSTEADLSAWAKERGISLPKRVLGIQAGEEFYSEVAQALRGLEGVSKHARVAASKIRPLLDDIYETARQAGVKGFDKEPLENFFPRMYSSAKVNRAVNRYGEQNLVSFFREAIIAAADEIPEALAEKIAKGYTRTLRRASSGIDQQLMHGIPMEDMDRLRELLGDGPDVDEIIDAVEAFKARRATNADRVTHAKSRVRLDEGYGAPIRTLDGETEVLRLTDLTENDARRVLSRYFQVMSGHIGLAKEAGITSRSAFDAAKNAIVSRGEAAGVDPRILGSEVDALEKAYKLITGQSIEENVYSTISQASRALRDFNFARVSGKFGVAQIAELGNIVGVGGVRAFIRHLPELQRLTQRATDGKLTDDVARQLDEWFGPGTDFETHPAIRAFDDFGEGFDTTTRAGRVLSQVDTPLQIAKRTASVASLMAPINARLEKMAAKAHVLEMSGFARGKVKLSESRRTRWRGAGLDDATQDRVVAAIKENAEYRGGRLIDLHVEKWDPVLADNFAQALRRQTSLTIQRNDFGDIPTVMYGPAGRLLFQFKSFLFGSINKQLNRGIHYRDAETFVAWSASMFFAGMGYIAQAYVDHGNDAEKRKEMLQPEQIAAAAFQRAGFAALLIPPAATLADLAGAEGVFNHRTSGLASHLSLDSNPTSQLLNDILTTAKLPAELLNEDYRFSQADLRRIERLLPFHRVLGVKQALHLLEEDLPERSTQ